ncbi:MAG: hypothetical protein A3K10_04440 [Bacteroidetes bacterium RIFCSPLOWO2_12_FULL_31_6]|nr:MAG: hypothetical protein A3K10_04440 [Bacteroidetes bacterium RIFCSPLOWO2_12_FULL_31_6]
MSDGEYMDTTSGNNEQCKEVNTYYYSVGGKYPESSSSLLKEAQIFLEKNSKTYSNNGYITFRFRINCDGKMMKKVQVLQTDENYKTNHFDKMFVNELFSFIKILDKWKIAKTKKDEPYSYITFITFKIKNGKVINIIP